MSENSISKNGLIQELRNRRVFRVAAVYLGVGYAILEASSIIVPMLGFSEVIVKIILGALVAGFPLAVILAWMFQLTPDGLRRSPREGEKQTADEKPLTSNTAIVALLTIIVILMAYQSFFPSRHMASDQITVAGLDPKSVAVLPFTPFTKTVEDESFADGVHDDILTQLSKIADLKVISRTSVMQYKETTKLVSDIAGELGVANILEGSVRRAGDQIRIVAQLINAETDEHLWAETYDREYADIFSIQSDVAKKIASALKTKLTPEEESYITSRYTDNPEAWELYLRGKLLFDADISNRDTVTKVLAKATELDSEFLLPHVLLARTHAWLYFDGSGNDPSPERFEMAKRALQKAVSIAKDAPETHMAKGYYQYYAYRNYQEAMEEMSLALEMQPNNTELIAGLAYVKRRLGLWEEATQFMEKAVSLDPNDALKVKELRDFYAMQRKFERSMKYQERLEAITGGQSAENSGGRYWLERWMSNGDIVHARTVLDDLVDRLGQELTRGQRYRQAYLERDFIKALSIAREDGDLTGREAVDLYPFFDDNSLDRAMDSLLLDNDRKINENSENWMAYSHKGMVLALLGETEEAIALGRRGVSMMPLSRDAVVGPNALEYLADIYMWSGRLDEAIETYQKVIAVPNWVHPVDIMVDPYYDPLRQHPEYSGLIPASRISS